MKLSLPDILRPLFIILIAVFFTQAVQAQNTDSAKAIRQKTIDSTRQAQARYNDSVNNARKGTQDSMRTAQKRYSDSIKAERTRVADSIASVRSYLQSKAYNDSVDLARQRRLDSIKTERERVNDSIAAERKRVADSTALERQKYNDSVKIAMEAQRAAQQRSMDSVAAVRKHMADSVSAVNAYRQSDHYKDSVAAVRKHINDSVAAVRKEYTDSIRTAQQKITDSMNQARQQYNDSVRVALEKQREDRQHYLDSMAVVRQVRTDSLAKARETREAARKVREKEKDRKLKLALEIKTKKQQDAYTNEKMRRKKWSLTRQLLQNTFTRYNYFFNANRKMEEAEANMLRAAQDNYDNLIALFVFDPDKDSSKVVTDMDTIVRKASIGIQLHDPRGKWQDNLYMLVGNAYYYKGDYKNAAAAYKWIIAEAEAKRIAEAKEANKKAGKRNTAIPLELGEEEPTGLAGLIRHRASKNDAMLALAQTFTQSGETGQAQSLLDLLRSDSKFPKEMQSGLALQQAFIDLKNEDYDNAMKSLAIVTDDPEMDKVTRQRAAFLNGQLHQRAGKYAEADSYFYKTIGLKPAFEMDFYARMNIANLSMLAQTTSDPESLDLLSSMARDAKYRPYYDQVYYGIGKYYLNAQQTDEAIENLKKSVSFSQSNKKQKGMSYASLGKVYFSRNDYSNAKRYYDSAAALLTAEDGPYYADAAKFSETLEKIGGPASEIKTQDSLLTLAGMSDKDQRTAVRKYIRDQEKLMRDSTYASQNITMSNPVSPNAGQTGQWYFANPSLMQQGSNAFKQKWSNRPLKDNWRRSSSSGFESEEEEEAEEATVSNSLNEDTLMAAIPHTTDQIEKVNKRLEEAYYSLGKAYYAELQDFPQATTAYNKLDSKYPQHNHQPEVLYHRYIMAVRANDVAGMANYKSTLLAKFPSSEYAKLIAGSSNESGVSNQNEKNIVQHYDETYDLLMKKEYDAVIRNADAVEQEYPSQAPQFGKQYKLLKAVAIAGKGDYGTADTMISEFLKANPKDSLAPWANDVLQFIRKNNPGKTIAAPVIASSNIADTAIANPSAGNQVYGYDAAQKHFVLLSAPVLDGKLMGVKAGIIDYNMQKHSEKKIKVSITSLQDGRGLLILKEFTTIKAAKDYLADLKKQGNIFQEFDPGEVEMLLIGADNLNVLYQTNNYTGYKDFYKKNYK